MVAALIFGLLYSIPNLMGNVPAIQISAGKVTTKIDTAVMGRVETALKDAGIEATKVFFDGKSVRAKFTDTDAQFKAQAALKSALNTEGSTDRYTTALYLTADTPEWMNALNALPMYLGLDLRGGIHFLMEVDMSEALLKRLESTGNDIRTLLREDKIRHRGIERKGDVLEMKFKNAEIRDRALRAIQYGQPELSVTEATINDRPGITGVFSDEMADQVRQSAIQQNITTLGNRVNELGVAEPVIQRQGVDRIIVQLPGVQDSARAKDILGRIATLEVRLVCGEPDELSALANGTVPLGCEKFPHSDGSEILLRKQIYLTGENLNDAQPGFDSQDNQPSVNLVLDSKGARIFKNVTRRNVGKRMAIILYEKGTNFRCDDYGRSQRLVIAVARRFSGRTNGNHRRAHDWPKPG